MRSGGGLRRLGDAEVGIAALEVAMLRIEGRRGRIGIDGQELDFELIAATDRCEFGLGGVERTGEVEVFRVEFAFERMSGAGGTGVAGLINGDETANAKGPAIAGLKDDVLGHVRRDAHGFVVGHLGGGRMVVGADVLAADVLDVEDTFAASGSGGRVPLTEVLGIVVAGADLDDAARGRCGRGAGRVSGEGGGDACGDNSDIGFHGDSPQQTDSGRADTTKRVLALTAAKLFQSYSLAAGFWAAYVGERASIVLRSGEAQASDEPLGNTPPFSVASHDPVVYKSR